MNIAVQISVWALVFSSFGYIPKIRITWSYGKYIFNFLCRVIILFFRNGYAILYSYQQCSVSVFPQPCQYLFSLSWLLFLLATLLCLSWHLIVVLICIFLLMILRIFLYSYWPFVYLLWRGLFKSFTYFQLGCLNCHYWVIEILYTF